VIRTCLEAVCDDITHLTVTGDQPEPEDEPTEEDDSGGWEDEDSANGDGASDTS
jgi:hypothetical protein